MINIKRFFDRVTAQEQKNARDVIINLAEAQALRDEIAKLLADSVTRAQQQNLEPIDITVKGGSW